MMDGSIWFLAWKLLSTRRKMFNENE